MTSPTSTGTDAEVIRVLIVEDHAMVGDALGAALAREPDLHVVAMVSTAACALTYVGRHEVDLVLLDLRLAERTDSTSSIPQFRQTDAACKVLVLSASADERMVRRAVNAGCDGYVLKDDAISTLPNAIRDVARGRRVFSPQLSSRTVRADITSPPDASLSDRELEILYHLATGASTNEVANTLFLSVNTVRNHVQNCMTKLGAHSRLEAVSIAVRSGLISI